MDNTLIKHLEDIHTTELGQVRIKRNLKLECDDVCPICIEMIKKSDRVMRKGKNYYIYVEDIVITVNAYSYTIITAHRKKKEKDIC